MPPVRVNPVEALRRVWSPGREIEEVISALDPQTELDSLIRDFLHRVIQQKGPQTLLLSDGDAHILNTGSLRWEIVHHAPKDGTPGRREVTLWVEH